MSRYHDRIPPLHTSPEQFWVNLFRHELGHIPTTKAGYFKQRLIRNFLSELRITPMEFDRGLIQGALHHHLQAYPPLQRNILVAAFKNWARLPSCLKPSSEPANEAQRSARSHKARIKAA